MKRKFITLTVQDEFGSETHRILARYAGPQWIEISEAGWRKFGRLLDNREIIAPKEDFDKGEIFLSGE